MSVIGMLINYIVYVPSSLDVTVNAGGLRNPTSLESLLAIILAIIYFFWLLYTFFLAIIHFK